MKASTVEIEAPVNKIVEKVYIKISHNGKYNKSGVVSSTKSVSTCHKCGKRAIWKVIANIIEMVLVGNYPRDQQESFKMGHQEAYDFRFRISDNSHY